MFSLFNIVIGLYIQLVALCSFQEDNLWLSYDTKKDPAPAMIGARSLGCFYKPISCLSIQKIKTVGVHYFSPNSDKVFDKFFLIIILSIHLCIGAQNGI